MSEKKRLMNCSLYRDHFRIALKDIIEKAVQFQLSCDYGSDDAEKTRAFVYVALDLSKALDTIKEEEK